MFATKIAYRTLVAALLISLCASIAQAQTTEFTYQGKLTDSGAPVSGNYDLQFRLFDIASGGVPLGTQTKSNLLVTSGIFTAQLDFGGNFKGAARFLEIAVKVAGSPDPFTVLSPRQPITSTPYAIRSLEANAADTATNSAQLGGVSASQYVITSDPRLSDARPPTAGSASYIQNATAPQSSSNFNISGDGTANIFNAATQFNLGGLRALSANGNFNFFCGL
jgi:hypothetical protein